MAMENEKVPVGEEDEGKAAYSDFLIENNNNNNNNANDDDNNNIARQNIDDNINKDKAESRYDMSGMSDVDKLMNVIFQLKQDMNRLTQEKINAEEILQEELDQLTQERINAEENVVKLTEENNILREELERAKKLAQSLQLQEQIVLPEVIDENEAKAKINAENNTPINSYDDLKNGNEKEQQDANELKRKVKLITDEYKQLESDIIANRDGKEKAIDFMRKQEIIFQKMRVISRESQSFFQGLNNHYSTIQTEVETVESETKKSQNKYCDIKQKYIKQIEEAKEAAAQCKQMFEQCRKMIDLQNSLLISKIENEKQLENLQKEQFCIQQLENQCKELLDSFQESHKKFNQDLIDLKKTIHQKFQEEEKNWYDWRPSAIVFFIQKTLNWWNMPEQMAKSSKLEADMIEKGIDGSNLEDLTPPIMMNSLGLIMRDAKIIYGTLQQLFEKYPAQTVHAEKIPDTFFCPVSNKLMEDPVDVYVGNSRLKESYPSGRLTCDRLSVEILLRQYSDRESIAKQIRIVDNIDLGCNIQEFIQNRQNLDTSKRKMKCHNNEDEGEIQDEGIDTRE